MKYRWAHYIFTNIRNYVTLIMIFVIDRRRTLVCSVHCSVSTEANMLNVPRIQNILNECSTFHVALQKNILTHYRKYFKWHYPETKCATSIRCRYVTTVYMYRVAQKTGPAYLIANIMKIPWPNCVEIGELLQCEFAEHSHYLFCLKISSRCGAT